MHRLSTRHPLLFCDPLDVEAEATTSCNASAQCDTNPHDRYRDRMTCAVQTENTASLMPRAISSSAVEGSCSLRSSRIRALTMAKDFSSGFKSGVRGVSHTSWDPVVALSVRERGGERVRTGAGEEPDDPLVGIDGGVSDDQDRVVERVGVHERELGTTINSYHRS